MSIRREWDLGLKVKLFLDRFCREVDESGFSLSDFFISDLKKGALSYIDALASFSELRYPNVYSSMMIRPNHLESIRKSNELYCEKFSWDDFNESFRNKNNFYNTYNGYPDLKSAVVYRIMEKGGAKVGPRRAALFAQDFGLDVVPAVQYGLADSTDTYRLSFASSLFEQMDSDDFEKICPVNYFLGEKYVENKSIDQIFSDGISEKRGYQIAPVGSHAPF